MYKLSELAQLIGGEVVGNGDVKITGIASLEDATSGDISFAADEKHLPQAKESKATAVVVPQNAEDIGKPMIRVANPRLAFAILLEKFAPQVKIEPGIHPTAVVAESAEIGENCSIGAHVYIGENARIGRNVTLYPGVFVGEGAVIGANTLVYPNVVIREFVQIGKNVIIQPGAVIGGDGFGFVNVNGRQRKVPQIGTVIIEDDVEIGANVTIDRATCGKTVVGRGTKIDNLVQLGHNVVIGQDCLIVAMAGVAGSAVIGNRVTLAGQSGVAGHISVGDDTTVAAQALVAGNIPAGQFVSGYPARPHREAMRVVAAQHKVPDLIKRVKALEKELEGLKEHLKMLTKEFAKN